ncbi:hypothetical protein [Actinoplanes ianthinogenes]|uniref:hypothetical protein n=1 Tax=Actinoplanes ianthinogenes TaxID=122358 RepID=UPI0016703FC1|nr:hypothetical protein [Actinoplanes ianthinogenes]
MTKLAVERLLATAPQDTQLKSATDAELVDLAVRCAPIRGLTYCLHLGWTDQGAASSTLQTVKAEASADSSLPAGRSKGSRSSSADSGANEPDSESSGDRSLVTHLEQWAALPAEERKAEEVAELEEAQVSAGKAVYMDAVINGRELPGSLAQDFPDLADWKQRAEKVESLVLQTEAANTQSHVTDAGPVGRHLGHDTRGRHLHRHPERQDQ